MPLRTGLSSPDTTVLYIKHMVCARGIRVVRQELERLGRQVLAVRLGAAIVAVPAGGLDWLRIRAALLAAQLPLLENPVRDLPGCVQGKVAELLRRQPALRHRGFQGALARELHLRPGQLRVAFADLGLGSLATYVLEQRLAYAQELLHSSKLSVSHIAHQLGYGSLAHFSGQFRRVVHCSPTAYRQRRGGGTAAVAGSPDCTS